MITSITLDGQPVPIDLSPPKRLFTGPVRKAILLRDTCCIKCGAPATWSDCHHIVHWADGGPTTLPNGRGLCARHNLAREQPGWHATVVHDGLGSQPHTVRTTTPTGHSYTSRAPDPP